MTHTQWLAEYYSLQQMEQERREEHALNMKFQLQAIRFYIIKLLGLDMLSDDQPEELTLENIKYLPLIWAVGKSEVLEDVAKRLQDKAAFEKSVQEGASLPDEEFDKLSQAVAGDADLGDMEPLIDWTPPSPEELWNRKENKDKLISLGIKFVDDIPAVPHISVDSSNINRKLSEANILKEAAKKEVAELIKEETANARSRGVKVTFDDK